MHQPVLNILEAFGLCEFGEHTNRIVNGPQVREQFVAQVAYHKVFDEQFRFVLIVISSYNSHLETRALFSIETILGYRLLMETRIEM